MTTTFSNKAQILSEIWLDYREDEEFKDFVQYNDLGLPLAYAVANGIADTNPILERFVSETFDLLLAGLGVSEDTGFEFLDDVFDAAPDN
jgi:hypothetical protein